MKVLHIVNTLDPAAGGPATVAIELCRAFNAKGYHAEIVTLDAPSQLSFSSGDCCNVTFLGPALAKYRYTPKLVPWLKEYASRFDAVIVHGIWGYQSFAAWCALHRGNTPYFVFTHGMLDPWFKRTYPFKHLKKLLYWPWAEYRVLRDARAVFFTCEDERILARRSFGLYKCNEVVVNYGILDPPGDPEKQKRVFLEKFPVLCGKKTLLFMGRIHPKKGCDILIRAIAENLDADSSLMLVMAGPDQVGWKKNLEKEAKRLGVADRVTWTGMIEGDVKWGALRSADAFVLPSHQENFGVAVVEALACGKPVLITNKVNIWREILADGAGLVSDDSECAITEMIVKWHELPDGARMEMFGNAIKCFNNRFRIERVVDYMVDVIRKELEIHQHKNGGANVMRAQ